MTDIRQFELVISVIHIKQFCNLDSLAVGLNFSLSLPSIAVAASHSKKRDCLLGCWSNRNIF